MVKLKFAEREALENEFGMAQGTVLEFSNRSFKEFLREAVDIYIYDSKYSFNGDSKAKRFRAFLEISDGRIVAQALRALFNHKHLDTKKSAKAKSGLRVWVI